ncbi:MAG: FAD-binding protein [Candidatus Altarchaeaceae archaeon]
MLSEEFKNFAPSIKIIEKEEEKEIYRTDIGDIPVIMSKTLFNTMPYFVVQPKNEDEIKKVLEFANGKNSANKKIPVIVRGAASWGFGGVIPTKSGIVIDLSPFRNIIRTDKNNKTITVQAGARWYDIENIANKENLSLMAFPSSKFSTVGGWLSTGGYGINSYKYGHISKQIVSIKVILPNGEEKILNHNDEEFKYFISTEGQFGIITEITLKLKELAKFSYPHIIYFADNKKAFDFVINLIKNEINPNLIRFLDEIHLKDTNEVIHKHIFDEKPSIIVEFDDINDDKKFLKFISDNNIQEAPQYVASYLGLEKVFGMKTKRLGPSILASEIIIPIENAVKFIEKAKKIGHDVGIEIGIDAYFIDKENVLIMATFLCDSKKLRYFAELPLVSMLTKIGISLKARPYGIGIWNTPFIKYAFDSSTILDYKNYKKSVDPNKILNPGKFFCVKSKFFNIPSLIFNHHMYNFSINLMIFFSPIVGYIGKALFKKEKITDNLDLELSTRACARCGNCIAVCPAYLITKNENVTAKGKIALAKKILNNKPITKEEAENVFLCMHCKACERVCQVNLELMSMWDAIEKKVIEKFGPPPKEKIEDFLKKVDESKEYWEMVERNI